MSLLREKLLAAAARSTETIPASDSNQLFAEEYVRLAGKKELTGSYAIIPPFYRPLPRDEDVLQQKLRQGHFLSGIVSIKSSRGP